MTDPRNHACAVCGSPYAPHGRGYPGGIRAPKESEALLWVCPAHVDEAEARWRKATGMEPRASVVPRPTPHSRVREAIPLPPASCDSHWDTKGAGPT